MSVDIEISACDLGDTIDLMCDDHVICQIPKMNYGFCIVDLARQLEGQYHVMKPCRPAC